MAAPTGGEGRGRTLGKGQRLPEWRPREQDPRAAGPEAGVGCHKESGSPQRERRN